MKLTLKRIAKKAGYTIGFLYVDGKKFCDTLEDTDRGLNNKMTKAEVAKVKIKDRTAIPTGTYKLAMNVTSPKYSNFAKYPYAKISGGKMPRVLNVPGFDGILVHAGNNADHTSGCILVGLNKVVGKLTESQATWTKLYKVLKAAHDKGEYITITIE